MRAIRIALVGIALLVGTQAAHAQCVGDCDGGNTVTVNELVTGVNIALDRAALSTCPQFDADSSGGVAVNELVQGVNNLLRGCGTPPTATPTTSVSVIVETPTPTLTTTGDTPTPTATTTVGPPGPASCTFEGAPGPNQSLLRLCLLGNCIAPFGASGEFGVSCGGAGGAAGAGTGSRDCECTFRRFDAVDIPGVGFACVTEPLDDLGQPVPCPAGTQDCDGGAAVNIDMIANHEVGTCSTNAECATKCDTFCAGLDPVKVRFSSGCERQCQGGARLDMPCDCDTLGTTTCPGSATTDCPGSSCEGGDNEADVDCHCQCIEENFGEPNVAGALRCRLPTSIRVESSFPCDGNGVVVRLPPLCAPLTTGTGVVVVERYNEQATTVLEPDALQGASVSCPAVDSGDIAGMTMVGNLTFFDSTVGDIISQLTLKCQ